MATLNYYIRSTEKKTTKSASIKFRLRHSELYLYAKTPYSIEIENWDIKKQRIKQGRAHSKRDTINNALGTLEDHIISLWNAQIDKSLLDADWLQDTVNKFFISRSKEIKETYSISLMGFINNFMKNIDDHVNKRTGRKLAARTIKKHERSQTVIKEFVNSKYGGILLQDINYQFYEDFLKYLTNTEGLAINTVGKYISGLKMFLNQAKQKGVYIDTDDFTKLSEISDSIYLNEDELLKIYNLDLSENKRLEKVRDLFIVGCWTGLRFGDLTALTKDIISGERVIIEDQKTGNKIPLPFHWMTKAILEKYKYDLPIDISNQKFNEYIKEVCDKAKIKDVIVKGITKAGKRKKDSYLKYKLVTAHTARRSFATNLYNSDFPTISIMAITGHKTEKAFLSYIKVTPEEHAKKLERHWDKLNQKD